METTLIVSDTHLGDPRSKSAELLRFLKSKTFNRLILNGDVFADLNLNRLDKPAFALLNYLRKLTNEKRHIEVVWVIGNHDLGLVNVIPALLGVPAYDEYRWEQNGKKCLALHGHQFDGIMTNRPRLAKFISWVFLELQKLPVFGKRLARWVDEVSGKWQRVGAVVSERALEYAKHAGADYVFCGHTHEPTWRFNIAWSVRYWNSGSWLGEDCMAIEIDGSGPSLQPRLGKIYRKLSDE